MVVVVGAGIIGCAIARELAVRGVACTVIDPRPVAGGATQASAGMLAPYVEAHERGPLLDLAVRSLDLFDGWIAGLREEGGAVEYRRIGTLEVALTAAQAIELRRGGGGRGEWLEPEDVARTFPDLTPTAGALRIRAHGYVDAPQLARALAQSAERHGASLLRARVARVAPHGGGVRVRADGQEIDAETVVLAAGAWTNAIEGIRRPPLRPVRGQLLHVARTGRARSTILWGPDCYVVPRLDGTVLVGATVEDAGFDERTTPEGVAGLLAAAQTLLPGTSRSGLLEARVGLRPATPDELPVLGRDPEIAGLVHASGHFRNGVLLAPITAKVIGDLIVDGRSDPSLQSFRADRF